MNTRAEGNEEADKAPDIAHTTMTPVPPLPAAHCYGGGGTQHFGTAADGHDGAQA